MHDLLRCYYSTVHVVRLPEKSRYQLLNWQRAQFHKVIEECCAIAYRDKQERELLTDIDEFGLYLYLAFDHFSETLDEPFDFVEASLKRNVLATSFAGDLLVFARRAAVHENCQGDVIRLFWHMAPFVASCILLESARKQRIGRPEDWFGDLEDDDGKTFIDHKTRKVSSQPRAPKANTYRDMCRKVIMRYFKHNVPCDFAVYDSVAFKNRPCTPRYVRHESSHRAKVKLRTIDVPGQFRYNFEYGQLLAWE